MNLMHVQAYAKYNNNHRNILIAIYVFWKFLNMIALKKKSGPSVASAFPSMFDDLKYLSRKRRPIWVPIDKSKELLNKHFQLTLRGEGVQFQVCKPPTTNVRS